MLKCDICTRDLDITEAVFMGDSVTCNCCKPSESNLIGGLPASVFAIFVESYVGYYKSETCFSDIMEQFFSHNEVIEAYRQPAEQCFDLFKENNIDKKTLAILSDIIPSAMFLSYLSKDEILSLLKEKNPDIDDSILNIAISLI